METLEEKTWQITTLAKWSKKKKKKSNVLAEMLH
jgi:hypothetical protein